MSHPGARALSSSASALLAPVPQLAGSNFRTRWQMRDQLFAGA